MVQFHPAFLHNALLNTTEKDPAVSDWTNPQHRSNPNCGNLAQKAPRPVELSEEVIEPTTQPILTKIPLLNPKWFNLSVGSDESSKSGQEWLLQQQNQCKDQVHSIDQKWCRAKPHSAQVRVYP